MSSDQITVQEDARALPANKSIHTTPTAAHYSQVAIALVTGWKLYRYERARDFKR